MSVTSKRGIAVKVELDSDGFNEHLRSSAAILREILKGENVNDDIDRTTCITVEPAVEELITGDLPASTGDGKSYACKHCGKLYKTAGTLQLHSQLKHPSEASDIEVRCVTCDKTYGSLLSLQKHQRYMHRFSHRCKACYRTFEMRDQLAEHAISCVRSERPCPTCGKMYESQLSLRNHVKYKHPEAKTNWCGICRRAFTSNRGLVNHVVVMHPGRIECASCGKKFTSVSSLQSHVLYKHSENGHRCIQCKKVFASYGSLSRHLAKNHNMVVYDSGNYCCGVCADHFTNFDALLHHVMEQHTGIKQTAK